MSCDVGLTDIQPLSLTCPRGSQEKHVSLNLRPSVFSELRGGREKNANRAQSQINWDLPEKA